MPSYVITGVSRGIGYEFLRQYSSDPNNVVIGVVRDKKTTDAKIAEDAELAKRSNVHILEADLTDYKAMQSAVAATAAVTGGSLDYFIGNAAMLTDFDQYDPIGTLAQQPDELTKTMRALFETNVIAYIHLFSLFLPLIQKGQAKKMVAITSGMADTDLVNEFEIDSGALYSTSKAALNMIVAKFNAQYKKDGILFLAQCPGMVDVGRFDNATPEQTKAMGEMVKKFSEYAPHFQGPDTPEQSVRAVRSVIANASIAKGDGGAFLSHFGNKQWL